MKLRKVVAASLAAAISANFIFAPEFPQFGKMWIAQAANAFAEETKTSETTTEKMPESEQSPIKSSKEDAPITENSSEKVPAMDVSLMAAQTSEVLSNGNFDYTVSDDGITITGYKGIDSVVVVPDYIDGQAVTKIGAGAFSENKGITSIVLPDGVTEIESYAFYNCSSLENINYPRSLTTTGSDIFSGCESLKSITIPEGVTEIPQHAFYTSYYDNNYIEEIVLPNTIEKIGDAAFYNCANLTKIDIPDNVTIIDSYAFYNCSGITEIKIPDGVTEIGNSAFNGCTSLESINYPRSLTTTGYDVFSGCTNLKSIEIADGVTEILSHAFYTTYDSNNYLEEIILPSSIKKIGSSAFCNCANLTKINIPDGVTEIGNYAFQNCKSLQSINYPRSLTTTGYDVFSGCTNLKSIEIADGVTEILSHAFYTTYDSNNYLEEIILPSTIKKIGSSAFYNCANLTKIEIPDSVTEIESYAFYNCSSLESIKLPDNVKLDSSVFQNCTNLVVYCPLYSETALRLIRDNNVIEPSISSRTITDKTVLDYNKCFYTSNFSSNTNSGCLSMICEYAFDASKFKTIKNTQIEIYIPHNCICLEETLLLNGEPIKNYTLSSDMLTIPVTTETGRVTVSFKRTESGTNTVSYAVMNYTVNNSRSYDIIGILNYNVPTISLETGKNTNSPTIKVSGIAPASSSVDIYADDVLVGTFNSNKVGLYEGEVSLPNPADNHNYIVKAQSKEDESLCAETSVNYSLNNPVVKEFTMTYNGRDYDLTSNIINSLLFEPFYSYQFKIKIENYDNVDKVYVVSFRNGEKKYLEANWDENTQTYITTGNFDPNDSSYVPGTISVEFSKPRKTYTTNELEEEYDKIIASNKNNLPDCSVNQTVYEDGTIEYSADLSTLSDLSLDMVKMTVKEVGKSAGFDWGYLSSLEDFYSYYIDKDSEKYFLNLDMSDPKTVVMYIDDMGNNKVTQYVIKGLDEYLDPAASATLSTVSGILSSLGVVRDIMDIEDDYDTLVKNINRLNMTSEERNEALSKAKELRQDRAIYTVAMFAITTLMAGSGGLPFALLTGAFGVMSKYFFNIRAASILNGGYTARFNWCIDPSGYVFDKKTGERIPDVKTTLYCIPYDEDNENFWNEVPDDSKAVLWDASEYSQLNPVFTDADGNYAWDVPEGWWKVVYEKEGYETAESEWLPVPPPQTNVNIGLMPIDNEVSISGTITNFDKIKSSVKVELLDDKGNPVANYEITDGKYVINIPEKGSYTLRFSAPKYCPREYQVSVEDSELSLNVEIRLYGDINNDGKVNSTDILKAKLHSKGSQKLVDYEFAVADVTNDGKVNSSDVLKLKLHAKGSISLW